MILYENELNESKNEVHNNPKNFEYLSDENNKIEKLNKRNKGIKNKKN